MRHVRVTLHEGTAHGALTVELVEGETVRGATTFRGFEAMGTFTPALRAFLATGEVAPRFA